MGTPDGRVVEPMEVMPELKFSCDPLFVLLYMVVTMVYGVFSQEKGGKLCNPKNFTINIDKCKFEFSLVTLYSLNW